MFLTNREMFSYFREANVVKTHNLHAVIERHCLTMEFIKQLEAGDAEDFQDYFGKFLRAIDGYLNTDALVKQFGKADVYDNAKLNLANNASFRDREVKVMLWAKGEKEEKGP